MTDDPTPPPRSQGGTPPNPHWTALSVALLVTGLLILVPSGLCTAVLGLPVLVYNPLALGMVALIGGLPIAVGALLVYAALKIRRRD